ncbi:hypothetical protein JVU11DRAFT_7802 [Chiua virens]|nr:hypothetical protein JVU11DRAFT_7802 [Chiua virens]
MLAIPYRAKDVPAARAEFGHLDITIILTCLAYYYGGLTEEQLKIVFEILLEQDDPSHDYALWLTNINSVSDSLWTLSKVNIRSLEQWNKYIVPFFTWNQATIDYFLSKVVFPKYAKEFPWKISGSSWDITEKRNHLITGFSGTNDAHYLLPTSIVQHDPHHLHQRGTTAEVLTYLLRPENTSYTVMGHEDGNRWTTHEFLEEIVAYQPEILDLSGHQLAQIWLDLNRDPAGVIYFNEENELMVLARNGITVQPLRSSPLMQQLDGCVAYLDHAHTRGTDIKFPRGFRAAVTLGPKVTKDTLVQGCMRMRQLGRGHSVKFFASPEVDRQIRSTLVQKKQDITTADILRWAMYETWGDIQRWAPYWVQQGMNHKSQAVWRHFCTGAGSAEELTNSWLQPELKSLNDLYAPHNSSSHSLDKVGVGQKDLSPR